MRKPRSAYLDGEADFLRRPSRTRYVRRHRPCNALWPLSGRPSSKEVGAASSTRPRIYVPQPHRAAYAGRAYVGRIRLRKKAGRDMRSPAHGIGNNRKADVVIAPQHPDRKAHASILRIFIANFVANEEIRIVVECDGHDFHEKTKEQAARDKSRERDLRSGGVEGACGLPDRMIWRDHKACARHAAKLVTNEIEAQLRRRGLLDARSGMIAGEKDGEHKYKMARTFSGSDCFRCRPRLGFQRRCGCMCKGSSGRISPEDGSSPRRHDRLGTEAFSKPNRRRYRTSHWS